MTITLYFDQGTNPDIAQVQVQNKLQLAMPNLPPEVQQEGIRVAKSTRDFLLVVGLVSTDGSIEQRQCHRLPGLQRSRRHRRTPGVGDIQLFGGQFAMRIWLDADKLNNYALTVADVSAAIQSQNVQVTAGELGGLPAARGQRLNATVDRPRPPSQPRRVRRHPPARQSRWLPGCAARRGPNGTAAPNSTACPRNAMANPPAPWPSSSPPAPTPSIPPPPSTAPWPGSRFFPRGLEVVYPYDTTPFIRISIEEVVKTLLEAIGLVFLVMYLFLGNIRATLIPTIAVPVVLLASFAVLSVAGFSINTLTMFGIVLAIGLLVDDAIVVVENVERLMARRACPPGCGTQIHGPDHRRLGRASPWSFSAVFLPMAFFGGSTGVIYRQFSITIISAMLLSVFVAIVFTPAALRTFLAHRPNARLENAAGSSALQPHLPRPQRYDIALADRATSWGEPCAIGRSTC